MLPRNIYVGQAEDAAFFFFSKLLSRQHDIGLIVLDTGS